MTNQQQGVSKVVRPYILQPTSIFKLCIGVFKGLTCSIAFPGYILTHLILAGNQGVIRLSSNDITHLHNNIQGKRVPALEDAMLYLQQVSWTDVRRC